MIALTQGTLINFAFSPRSTTITKMSLLTNVYSSCFFAMNFALVSLRSLFIIVSLRTLVILVETY